MMIQLMRRLLSISTGAQLASRRSLTQQRVMQSMLLMLMIMRLSPFDLWEVDNRFFFVFIYFIFCFLQTHLTSFPQDR